MTCRLLPGDPVFADESERRVWEALRAWLRDDDVLLHGVRLTHPEYGDVEIDLLVLMPDAGAVVIEVKGGHVAYADGAWTQGDATGTRRIDPIGQARNALYALRDYLERQPTWSRGRVRSTWLVAFPYLDAPADLSPEATVDTVVDRQRLDFAAQMAFQRLAEPALHAGVPAAGWVEAAVDLLRGTRDVPGSIAGRTAARLRRADQLTAEQASVLSALRDEPRIEVRGAAGTGKTWLAMEQARRWAADGERVALVSYGRGVAAMMQRSLADLPARERPAFVGTFHGLAHAWGVRVPEDADHAFWADRVPRLMADAGEELPAGDRFTAFVVDEAQDFADSWWPALLAGAAGPDVRLAVFRDDEQSVFADRRGRPDLPLVRLRLDRNLRNSQQVVDTFRPLIAADVVAAGGDGFPVEYAECTIDTVIPTADDVVADLVDRRGWSPDQVALLTTKHRHPVHVEQGEDKEAYWADLWAPAVFYSTVAGFKGLERPAVVLAVDGFHEGVDPREVMYAGMSRARDLLVVVGPAGDLAAVLGDKTMRRLRRGRATAWPPPPTPVPPG